MNVRMRMKILVKNVKHNNEPEREKKIMLNHFMTNVHV